MGHGWEGVVLRLLRGRDFEFTVTATEQVTEHYLRIRMTDGGMLASTGVHPTMWVRLWFESGGKPHQRAYTLVDPDPATGTFTLEFALHEGIACDWARGARPGDTIEATVQGTGFTAPSPGPSRLLAVGDPASLPAVNSLLEAFPGTPATVWLETAHPQDAELPLRLGPGPHEVRWVPRRDAGAHLVAEVTAALPKLLEDEPAPYVWIACDTATTRALASYARKELGVPKDRVHALGYWRAT
ncbi:siderophore-interacting protein [Streptomyces fenghuangensis]|uniref:siderophore-interacting protein n=1 Tax=Streptomyces sp. ICN903 TaxID=2964654 RepID=UPI001EDBE99D|nr:siderophore-interacting protein [Streptomyces sp. ICN903]MCG3044395.1 siderophore-interacting protein [Streptomyces sp. ICN903]